MSEILAFLCGLTVATTFMAYLGWREWRSRASLERKVDRLYQHLSCGGGILGCTGGPNCQWEHK